MDKTDSRVAAGEAARILGVSTQTIRNLAEAGALPGEKSPIGWLFRREDVERVAAERRKIAGQKA